MKDCNGRKLKFGDPVRIVKSVEFPGGTEAEFRGVNGRGRALIYVKDHGGRGHSGSLCPSTAEPTGDKYGHLWVKAGMIELIEKNTVKADDER